MAENGIHPLLTKRMGAALLLEPGDERTSEIIAAIEDTTPLKVQPPSYDRSQAKADPDVFFVIDAKPF